MTWGSGRWRNAFEAALEQRAGGCGELVVRASNLLTRGSGHSTTRRLWKSQSLPRLAAKPAFVMFCGGG